MKTHMQAHTVTSKRSKNTPIQPLKDVTQEQHAEAHKTRVLEELGSNMPIACL